MRFLLSNYQQHYLNEKVDWQDENPGWVFLEEKVFSDRQSASLPKVWSVPPIRCIWFLCCRKNNLFIIALGVFFLPGICLWWSTCQQNPSEIFLFVRNAYRFQTCFSSVIANAISYSAEAVHVMVKLSTFEVTTCLPHLPQMSLVPVLPLLTELWQLFFAAVGFLMLLLQAKKSFTCYNKVFKEGESPFCPVWLQFTLYSFLDFKLQF